MLDKLGSNIKDSYDRMKSESPRRYMDYGLSAIKEKNDKEDIGESITTKIKDSEEKIEMLLGIIENLASEKDDKKAKNKKQNIQNKNVRKKLLERNKRDDASSEKTSTLNRKNQEKNKKGDYTESILKTEAYPAASSIQNLSTRISTNAANLTVLPNISNIYSSADSPINFKNKNILSKSLANSSPLRSIIRKVTNNSGIPMPLGNLNLVSPTFKKIEINGENKKLKFNFNLNIDISNSDKQDLINIITDENINNFTTNLATNSNNNNYKESSIINQTHSIIAGENTERPNNYNNINKNSSQKNSNLFLTKIDENSNNLNAINTRYSRFNNNLGTKASEGNPQGSSTNLQNQNSKLNNANNNNNNNEKEKLIHDFSIINNHNNSNFKEKENSMLSGSNLLNLASQNFIQNKKSITHNLTQASESENKYNNNNFSYKKQDSTNATSRLETNPNEKSTQSRSRIKGILSPNSSNIKNKNNINYGSQVINTPNNNKSNAVLKNAFSGNSQIKENYDGESELSSPKRNKNNNKSYFDILDLISKDYNLTEVTVPSTVRKNKNRNNHYYNSDLNNILKTNSENNINSIISSEDIFSAQSQNNNYSKNKLNKNNFNNNNNKNNNFNNNFEKFDLREKDSFDNNFLSPKSPKGSGSLSAKKKNDLHHKSKEFLDKFLSKCSSQENVLENQLKRIKSDLKKDALKIKSQEMNINRSSAINSINREIDKNVFLMDNKEIKRDKILLLLGSEGKDGKKKIFFENRSSPLFVGELISKINDHFAFRCKNILLEKFDNSASAEAASNNPQMHMHKNFQEYLDNQARLDIKHKEIDTLLFDMETCKNYSMKRIMNVISQSNRNNDNKIKEEKVYEDY